MPRSSYQYFCRKYWHLFNIVFIPYQLFRDIHIAAKPLLSRNYTGISSCLLSLTMDGNVCLPRGKIRDSQPVVAQPCQPPPRLIVFIAAFYDPQPDQDYRTFFLAVFPRVGGSAGSFGRSMVIVVDYGCTKCKGIEAPAKSRVALPFVMHTGSIKSRVL